MVLHYGSDWDEFKIKHVLWLCSQFSVFQNVCAHLVKVSNNRFPYVQTKFWKYTILGESTQFWSLEYTNRKFGVDRSGVGLQL